MSSLLPEAGASGPSKTQPYGEVFDRGYRHYDGQRAGRIASFLALLLYSTKRAVGIKKRWTAKIIPFALFAAAFIPVFLFILVSSVAGQQAQDNNFGYFELYGMIALIILLFGAATAPEMLCDDRRDGVLRLYFSRPLGRFHYLAAKMGALALLIGAIAFLPGLLLFLGKMFLDADPGAYFAHNIDHIQRILASGSLIAIFYASITLAVAACVDRKGIAATISLGGVLIVSGIVSALFDAINASWQPYLVLANPVMIPEGIVRWIFDATVSNGSQVERAHLGGTWYILSVGIVGLICGAIIYRRYLTED